MRHCVSSARNAAAVADRALPGSEREARRRPLVGHAQDGGRQDNSATKFGAKGTFGPHRFRYGIGTVAPVEDPEVPVAGAVILGITAQVHREHYDRGEQEVAARRFVKSLEAERRETEGYAKHIFERRRQGDLFESGSQESEAA